MFEIEKLEERVGGNLLLYLRTKSNSEYIGCQSLKGYLFL